mgnify:CR=1 FL=1
MLATLMLLHPVLSAVSMSLTIGFYLILLGVDGIVLALNAGLGLEANIAKICATALVMVYNFVTRKIFLEGDETK